MAPGYLFGVFFLESDVLILAINIHKYLSTKLFLNNEAGRDNMSVSDGYSDERKSAQNIIR